MHAFRLIREFRRSARRDAAAPPPARTPRAGVPRPTAALLAVTALLALPAAAHGMGLPGPVPAAPPAQAAATGELTVTYDDGSGRPRTYGLDCGPGAAGGGADTAGEQDGCRRLQEIGGPVGAVPQGQMCSMIYGGPQTADVRGTWAGRPVEQSYRRTNGCEVSRWSRMVPALPNPASPPARTTARTSYRTPYGTTARTSYRIPYRALTSTRTAALTP